jgi:hypothetical protein
MFPAVSTTTLPRLTSFGHELDTSPEAFGELRRSDDILGDVAALRARFAEDGYLFLPGLLDPQWVLDARREITSRLAGYDVLDPQFPVIDAVPRADAKYNFSNHGLAGKNPPLQRLLYTGAMIEFYERFLGGPVRHFDYTWFRAVPAGHNGIYPHSDVVYMGRGTKRLYTSWTPLGDVSRELGGLMLLENSYHQQDKLHQYLQRDVDTYCANYPDAQDIATGKKQWRWDGNLSKNPATLRAKLGGRWLTTDYTAGDVLMFSVMTVHCSLDNHSDRFRLSSDSRYQLADEPVDERWIGDNPIAHGVAGKRGRAC